MSLLGTMVGNYRLTAILGEGGMGAVYLGEHPLIGKRVAVKLLHEELVDRPEVVQRFLREARAVNDIRHDHIVDILDLGQCVDAAGRPRVYLVMELLEGESLASRLRRGPLSPDEVAHVGARCASALAASHRHGIVHRDIKPDNVFLARRGADGAFVKLLDFGIAKLTGAEPAAVRMTRTGTVVGTPSYMSPEQCDGRGDIDPRSDVYSLGVVLFEMMCGRVPFVGGGFGDLLVHHLTTPPPRPSELARDVPPALEAIAMRCLEKDRGRRYQTMEDLEAALRQAAGGGAGRRAPAARPSHALPTVLSTSRPSTTLSGSAAELGARTAPSSGSRRTLPIVALVALVAIAGAAGVWARSRLGGASSPAPVAAEPDEARRAADVARSGGTVGGSHGPRDDGRLAAERTVEGEAAPAGSRELVSVHIESRPSGAAVVRASDRAALGRTPLDLTLPPGERAFDVELVLDGYQRERHTIAATHDADLTIALHAERASPSRPGHPKRAASGRLPQLDGRSAPPQRDDVLEPSL